GVTQPALTRSLKSLEEALGYPLFERHPRGVLLTDAGKTLFQYCERLFAEVSDLEERLRAPGELAGVLTIGTYETLGISFWPAALRL
ncbi:LysR family transcriptional regulator, partial [Pseudomonas aeruginosa]|uniref:LysR family transcriptional regulator n=1 Tax=Pseudomonas aeruginosa TaxID=287 RepID=UPI001F3079B8